MTTFVPGDTVRTPLGTGVVREVRRHGRLLVAIGDHSVVVEAADAVRKAATQTSKTPQPRELRPAPPARDGDRRSTGAEVDLHGLVVAEAIERVAAAINAAILAGHGRLRVIHGRGGGRLRAALHQQLRAVPSVRAFRVDPANEGVTIVEL